jgi:hypothetical protein
MSKLKAGTGDVTHHATNKQFGKGPGAHNVELKKSPVNPNPPLRAETPAMHKGKGVGPARPTKPQVDDERRVLQDEKAAAGRNSTHSTFTAPRKDGPHDALQQGFTKPGKM